MKVMKMAVTGVLTSVLPGAGLILMVLAAVRSLPGVTSAGGGDDAVSAVGPAASLASVPAAMLRLYSAAATICPGLSWTVLAAIGEVESDHGRSDLPGVRSGANAAGAEGPMQFEPATFAEYDEPTPPGGAVPPSPYDPADAVFAAARMLCADGAGDPSRLGSAIFSYNHSGAYVARVLALAQGFGLSWESVAAPDPGSVALRFALSQVGIPYRWGAEAPGVAFDCSGLTQAAWRQAGVDLPRVAEDQMVAGRPVPSGQTLVPGDLVYFGVPGGIADHVGLVVDPRGVMVDAPHPGAVVRVEWFPTVPGAPWGDEVYLGATAPGG